jgi:hypothetical protein
LYECSPSGPLPTFTTAVAVDDVNCTVASEEFVSQFVAVTAQNITRPLLTGDPPDVTVAVRTIGVW